MKHHRVDQNTDLWMGLRRGMPTASSASCLVTSTGQASKSLPRYAKELAINRYAGKNVCSFGGNKSTQRGHEMEPIAAAWYEYERDRELETCGFFTDDLERCGASPDRTINAVDDSVEGLVEIKCQEAVGHYDTLISYGKSGKAPSSYISQTQMQLMITGAEWSDLVLFHPDLPSSIIRIYPDPDFHKLLKTQITNCIIQRDAFINELEQIT